jgi:PIN domain nuclease of toxin-antitoxin system
LSSLLVDSHALLWWRADDRRLGAKAREKMADPDVRMFFSAASIWEIAIKQAKGKLRVPGDLLDTMSQRGFVELAISARHAVIAGALAKHHADPFDRMIVAQAQSEGLTVVTRDPRFAAYGVPVLW